MATMTGTIKRLVSDKGFGFIAAGDGTEYFFHQSACNEVPFSELREGQAVTFERVRVETGHENNRGLSGAFRYSGCQCQDHQRRRAGPCINR